MYTFHKNKKKQKLKKHGYLCLSVANITLNRPGQLQLLPIVKWHFFGVTKTLVGCFTTRPVSFYLFIYFYFVYFKGPYRVLSVPAVLATFTPVHWKHADGEAVPTTLPCSWSTATSGPGPVGAVLGPDHREILLCQRYHQGEVLEATASVSRKHCQQGTGIESCGFFSVRLNQWF